MVGKALNRIQKKLEMIKSGEMKAEDNISRFLETINKKNKEINAFLYVHKTAINEARALDKKIREKQKVGKLAGLAIAVKANISVKGMPISCGSQTLKSYDGTFDADVIQKIKAEDGIIIGITNCDEFGCGSSGENSAFGVTNNPACLGKIPGGSSSGSAAAVAGDMCDIALGSDTGGSIRNPASHCGIVGLKPSYGRVSRYGLIDLAMSLDQIGPLCKDVYGAALMMEVISGMSDYDPITFDRPILNYTQFQTPKEITIGVPKEFAEFVSDKRILEVIDSAIKKLADELKIKPKQIKLKYLDLAIQTYYPLVYVEFYSATRKFDGRRYGKKIEESCGEEVLRRILGGEAISAAEFEGRYYRKALEVRELIKKNFKEAFEEVDVILCPTVPSLPHSLGTKIEDPKIMYGYDMFTVPVNLAGVCAGVIKAGEIEGVPIGLQVIADAFREDLVLNIMKVQEDMGGINMVHPAVENVIKNCLKMKKGESLLILADTKSSDIGMFFFQNAMQLSADIGFKLDYLEMKPTKNDGAEPAEGIAEQMRMFHVLIMVTTYSLSHTDATKAALKRGARAASMPGVTMDMIERTLSMDYNEIEKLSQKVAKNYEGKDKIHIRTEKGTDFTFSIKDRPLFLDTGILDSQGVLGNLPAGEVAFAPIEDSANGILIVDGSMDPIGKLKGDLKLEFKDGKVVSVEGPDADALNKFLTSEKNRNIAEFGIGTNPKAKITGNILEDEKVMGTIHIAIGSNTNFGGKNKADIHFDGIVLKPTVLADGLCTMKDGEINF